MKKIDVGKEVLMLHTKYIINNDKPKADFPLSGIRHLHYDEVIPFRDAVIKAPRIGRIRNNRKLEDELVIIPRGLLLYLVDEARYSLYFHDLWMKGELDRMGELPNSED